MIALNLPALIVVLPLVAAPVCTLVWRARPAWLLSLAVTWLCFAMAIMLMTQVWRDGPIDYVMGGWAAPWGIAYRIDALNALVMLIVSAIASVVMPYAYHSVTAEVPLHRHGLFYTAYLLTLTGLLGMAATGDAFNAFVFMEIASLSGYVLVALGRDRRALIAAFSYLILGTVGATFFVIGIGLMYIMTGTLNMVDLAERLAGQGDNRVVIAALAFLAVGLSLKAALFPLHIWLPNAYTYAPSMVSVLLSATGTKVAIYLLLRFLFSVYDVSANLEDFPLQYLLMPFALLAIVTGSLVAVFQTNIKRMLAYSSVAQVGYIVLGISLMTESGMIGAVVHLFNHALMKAALFMVMGALMLRMGGVTLASLAGTGRTMPLTMAAFVLAGLSLVGVPGTVGFISKWYLVSAAFERGWWPISVLVMASSLLAAVYIWKVIEAAFLGAVDDAAATAKHEPPWPMLAMTWVLAGACVFFGLATDITIGSADQAAEFLLGIVP